MILGKKLDMKKDFQKGEENDFLKKINTPERIRFKNYKNSFTNKLLSHLYPGDYKSLKDSLCKTTSQCVLAPARWSLCQGQLGDLKIN